MLGAEGDTGTNTVPPARRHFVAVLRWPLLSSLGVVSFEKPGALGVAMSRIRDLWKKTMAVVNRFALWSDRHLPPGIRAGLGVVAMAGGVVGFLPLVGFWMLPLGIVLIALDIPPFRRHVLRWLARQQSGM